MLLRTQITFSDYFFFFLLYLEHNNKKKHRKKTNIDQNKTKIDEE